MSCDHKKIAMPIILYGHVCINFSVKAEVESITLGRLVSLVIQEESSFRHTPHFF